MLSTTFIWELRASTFAEARRGVFAFHRRAQAGHGNCQGLCQGRNAYAHIGSVNEAEATELAKCAEKLGYNAISSVASFYYKFSFEEIKGYYNRLADSVELPMLVYHFPAFSGVNMGAGEISQFLENDKFLGVKFTSNDFFTLEQIKSKFPNKTVCIVLWCEFFSIFVKCAA